MLAAAIGVIVAACLQPLVSWFHALDRRQSLILTLVIVLVFVTVSFSGQVRDFLERHAKPALVILALLVGYAPTMVVAPMLLSDDSCPAPTELRLVTAPENVPELRDRTGQYVDANRIDGCPSLRMTVAAAPPPVHLWDAFTNNWERLEDRRGQPYARLYDLQPDAWVASSSAGPGELRDGGLRSLGDAGSDPVVGQDQLVLAMTVRHREELDKLMENPDSYPLDQVWDTLRTKMGMTIARPFPETSMSALIGTHDVYRGLKLSPAEYRETERELVTGGLGADTVSSLLCEFDRLAGPGASGGEPPGGARTALLVPGHSVADFNAGRVDGCPGTGRGEQLVAVRHHEFSALHYRYVGVTWPGQPSPERQKLVEGFGAWLRKHPLFPDVPVSSSAEADADRLAELKKLLLDDLRPQLDLRLMIDTSGSADRPVRIRAAEAIRGQSRILGPRDHVEVFGLSSRTERGPAEVTEIAARSTRRQLGAIATRIEDAGFDRWDAPASAGLRTLATGDDVVPAPVMLLTDGRLADNENGAGAAAALGAALRKAASVSGLYVIVFGQNRCAVPELQGVGKPYQCVPAGDDVTKTITRAIITVRGWR